MSCTQQHHGRRWLGGLLRARLAGAECRIDLLCLAVADEKDLTCVGIRFRGCSRRYRWGNRLSPKLQIRICRHLQPKKATIIQPSSCNALNWRTGTGRY